jgi:hypothetical protein
MDRINKIYRIESNVCCLILVNRANPVCLSSVFICVYLWLMSVPHHSHFLVRKAREKVLISPLQPAFN